MRHRKMDLLCWAHKNDLVAKLTSNSVDLLNSYRLRISVNVTGHFASNVTDFFISVARGLKCNRIGHDAAVSSVFFRRNDSPFITIR